MEDCPCRKGLESVGEWNVDALKAEKIIDLTGSKLELCIGHYHRMTLYRGNLSLT